MIKPVRDRILVKPSEAETKTASGLVIPDQAVEKPLSGTVLGVGEGHIAKNGTIIPLEVKTGDVVLYAKNTGQTIKIDNVDHIVLREDDVLGIVE